MSINFRVELERLVQAYDEHGGRWPQHHEDALHDAVEVARAALAQPGSQGLTDEELLELAAKALGYKSIDFYETCLTAEAGELLAYARAAIAADRARAALAQPAAEKPADEVQP